MNVSFLNENGDSLHALLDEPAGKRPRACAIFAHCFTCGKNIKAIRHISEALTRQGIAVLRFDFTGLGESGGDFSETNFTSNVSDLVHAARFLEARFEAPSLLVGHSLGGAAVLQAAAELPSVRGVATIGAPADPSHVVHLLRESEEVIRRRGDAEVHLGGRTFRIRKQFLDDLEETRMTASIRSLDKALLVLHSPIDNVVGIKNAAAIFQAARHPKSFISLDTADHLLTSETDSAYAGQVIGAWAAKYISDPRGSNGRPGPRGSVVVTTGRDHYRTHVSMGPHVLVADEPESAGGTDEGPTPYDLLLASLGACTTITMRMYADRKDWPVESIGVILRHRKMNAKDCQESTGNAGRVDVITKEIDIRGALDQEQLDRLMEIADKCPVHRTLHGELIVRTRRTGEHEEADS